MGTGVERMLESTCCEPVPSDLFNQSEPVENLSHNYKSVIIQYPEEQMNQK